MRALIDPPSAFEHYRSMAPLELRAAATALGVDRDFLNYHDGRLRQIDHRVKMAGTDYGRAEIVLALDFELGLRFIDHFVDGRRSYPLTPKGAALAVFRDLRRRGIDILGTPTSRPTTTKEPMQMTAEIDKKPTLTVASAIDTATLTAGELSALAYRLGISRASITLEANGYLEAWRRMARAGQDTSDFPVNLYRYRKLAMQIMASGEMLQPGTRRTLRTEVALRIDQLEQQGIDVYGDGHAKWLHRVMHRRSKRSST